MSGGVPAVSIVTPTHNRANLLRRAMASVREQTWRDFEWIVVDDCSTDATTQVLDACADPRLVRVRLEANLGVAGARNAGIQRARGEYVAFLDDDDEYLPHYLRSVMETFRSGPSQRDVVWTGVERVLEHADGSVQTVRQIWDRAPASSGPLTHLTQLNMSCGLCVRRESLLRIGLFDEELKVSEDTDMLLRLAAAGCRFGPVADALIRVHVHLAPSLSRSSRYTVMAACNARLVEKNRVFLDAHPELWIHFHDMLAGDYYRAQERTLARDVIRRMLQRAPLRAKTWEKWLRFELLKRGALSSQR
jgi:glycosyltransferase involved in cell wall biosynthesis